MELLTTLELSKLSGVPVDQLRNWHRKKKFADFSKQFVPKGAILWDKRILQKLQNEWFRTTRRTSQHSQPADGSFGQSRHSGKANQCWHRNQSGSDRASGWVGEIKKNSRQGNSQNSDRWLRQSFQLIDRVDALGEAAGTALPHWTVYMGNQSLVFVMAEGSASSLSKASPPNMELNMTSTPTIQAYFFRAESKNKSRIITHYSAPWYRKLWWRIRLYFINRKYANARRLQRRN